MKLPNFWLPAFSVFSRDSPVENCGSLEKVCFTSRPTKAVMHFPAALRFPDDRSRSGPIGRIEGRDLTRAEGQMAQVVRDGAATVQPALPGEPARLPNSGAGVWRT